MTYKQLYKHYRSQRAIAEVAGVEIDTVKKWRHRGSVPRDQQIKFQVGSQGALKVS